MQLSGFGHLTSFACIQNTTTVQQWLVDFKLLDVWLDKQRNYHYSPIGGKFSGKQRENRF